MLKWIPPITLFALVCFALGMSFIESERRKGIKTQSCGGTEAQCKSLEKRMVDVQWRLEILEAIHTNELEAVKQYQRNMLLSSAH